MTTEEGREINMSFQCAEISQICDAGTGNNVVVFGKKGGYVYHADQQVHTEFGRRGGVYPLRKWLKRGMKVLPKQIGAPEAAASFQRQGF